VWPTSATCGPCGATTRAAVTPTPVPTPVPTATPPPAATLTPEQAVRPVVDATVYIETNKGRGSGVVLGAGGVVTSYHVVDGASSVTVQFADQRSAPARVVRVDRRRDLALLAVETRETPLALGDTERLQPGGTLMAVGYPRSSVIGSRSATITRGAFSALWRSPDDVWYVQTDAAVNPGNSGGPLVDAQGRVVGIVTFGLQGAEGLNYAVAANEVRVFLASADNPPLPPPPPPPAPAPPAPAPPAAPAPAVPQPSPAVETLQRYYELVNGRQYEAAYPLLSTHLRSTTSLQTFRGWNANKHAIVMRRVLRTEAVEAGTVIVHAQVTSTDTIDGQVVTRDYDDAWTMVREGAAWRLDSVKTTRL
jgi:Trypsin-like peptidase domain